MCLEPHKNFILLLLRSIYSWRGCRVHVKLYWHWREQGGCSVCFAGYRPCLSLLALCFLFSCLQSHVDSYPITPKHVSGELLFNHMLPVFEQLKLQHHFLLVLVWFCPIFFCLFLRFVQNIWILFVQLSATVKWTKLCTNEFLLSLDFKLECQIIIILLIPWTTDMICRSHCPCNLKRNFLLFVGGFTSSCRK